MKRIYKIVSLVLATSFVLIPVFSSGAVDFDETMPVVMDGLKPMERDVIDAHKLSTDNQNNVSTQSVSRILPSSVDLSNSIYFPPIRDQGNVNSCAAFAGVYYQYTYAVNLAHGTSAGIEANQFSPNWPYYALISDNDSSQGLSFDDVYSFLTDHGALRWNQDIYDNTAFDATMPWPTNMQYVKDALLTRVYDWRTIEISNEQTVITSNCDTDLESVKEKLKEGKLLTVGVFWNGIYSNLGDSNRDRTIFYRFGNSGPRHALTIVGYDDYVTYDIDGDGTIEDGEKGAFKIANSYGTEWGDDGFFWIMYDALNGVSSVDGDWDNTNTRSAAFANVRNSMMYGTVIEDNLFICIYVQDKTPLLLAEINLTPHDRTWFEIELRNEKPDDYRYEAYFTSYGIQDYEVPQSRTLIFDYQELIPTFDDVIGETDWMAYLMNLSCNPNTIVSSIRLTDNLYNTVRIMSQDASDIYNFSCTTNFAYGDVDYSGSLTENDADIIMKIIADYSGISNVQRILADYNRDGKTNLTDVTAVLRAIEGE